MNRVKTQKKIKFFDFCAGIGAGRIGLENAGFNCTGFSEIDQYAECTYREFFGAEEKNYGDLMKINPNSLPDFELLIAGFPCQSFSIIGQRKGLNDQRGQIIYGLIQIMNSKNVSYFILENVKGLLNHDEGKTLRIILNELEKAGYQVHHHVLNSLDHGVPHMRERIYFVGIRKDLINGDFQWPKPILQPNVSDYLIENENFLFDEKKTTYKTFLKYLQNKYNKELFTIDSLLQEEYLILDTRQSDLRLYRNKVPTLRTGRHGILYVRNGNLRSLSGAESLLLQGFPKKLVQQIAGKIADVCLLRQSGNAMTVKVIEAIGKSLLNYITQYE